MKRGRPRGVPAPRRLALEYAYLDLLWRTEGRQPRAASPPNWKRTTNVRRAERLIVADLQKLGFSVSTRSVRAAINDLAPLPLDERSEYPDSVRYAGAMLAFADKDLSQYPRLVDAIYAWCVSRTRAGRRFPLDAAKLAHEFQKQKIKAGKKITGSR